MNIIKTAVIATFIFAMAGTASAATTLASEWWNPNSWKTKSVKAKPTPPPPATAPWCGYQEKLLPYPSQGYSAEGTIILNTFNLCVGNKLATNYMNSKINSVAPYGCASMLDMSKPDAQNAVNVCHALYTTFLVKKAPY